MTDQDHKCPRCGHTLKTVTVQVPVYDEHQTRQREGIGAPPLRSLIGYEDQEELADCIRCLGAY